MVSAECVLLPVARYFDKQAQPFINAGVPIVKNDFIDMDMVLDANKKTKYAGESSPETNKLLQQSFRDFRKARLQYLKNGDYPSICQCAVEMLALIDRKEEESQAHFANSKHLFESVGFAALHAPQYLEQSNGGTEKLGKQLVGLQLWLADTGIYMDKLAQGCHKRGAGILVNDVPYIPFLEEFNR